MSSAIHSKNTASRAARLAKRASRSGEERGRTVKPASYFTWHLLPQRMMALFLLVPGLPVILLLVILVRLTSRGPGIYRQTRVGFAGRHFRLYKLRSMRADAEAGSGAVWARLGGDPRVTRFGRVLRKTHLDELPQLFNVVKGEMALVGPRPERPEFTHKLALAIPGYMERHAVRPGITGLAQINLPPDTDLDSVRRKLVLDMRYITDGGLWLDTKIMACTLARLFCIKGPRVTRFFGVEQTVPQPTHECEVSDIAAVRSNGESDETESGPSDMLATASAPRMNGRGQGANGNADTWLEKARPGHRRPK